jgi:hypothetical protein
MEFQAINAYSLIRLHVAEKGDSIMNPVFLYSEKKRNQLGGENRSCSPWEIRDV